jgi:4-amino-4-deoxy-L-arabinose transferase-like glycosyltransferase
MHRKLTWLLFFGGLLLRCVALHQPLVDSGLLRQCQTAAVTRDLLAQGGFPLSSAIPWAGDLHERFVLELPLYNYLAIAVTALTGDLVLSGKLVSIALWAAAFWLLQNVWRRMLPPGAVGWANLLFVASPLGVFYAQAFMPESLVQLLAFAFVLLVIRYDEVPTLPRWWAAAAIGLLGLLVKSVATVHLYALLLFLILSREGWRSLLRPRYLAAGFLTAAGVFAWGRYLDAVNVTDYSFSGSGANLRGFIGSWQLRVQWRTWWKITLYLGGFLAPGLALLAVARGVPVALQRRSRFLIGWLLALVIYYLLWLGNGPASQGYYNLPALAPLAALFGLGVCAFLQHARIWPRIATALAVAATLVCAAPVWKYLYTPDRTILTAALWTRQHTAPGTLVLLRAAHRADMLDYAPNAVFPFYAERPTLVWVAGIPEPYRTAALERSRCAVITKPQPEGSILSFIRRLRGLPTPPPESADWLLPLGFTLVADEPAFRAFERP